MPLASITGAFSYSGTYIAEAFLEAGWQVRTLTRNPTRAHRLQGKIETFDLYFARPDDIAKNLAGSDLFINTYWIRFDHKHSSFAGAIDNSRLPFESAKKANVRRIIHLSVSHADINSSLPYYSGKAKVEKILADSGVPYSILRPTLIFGEEELLVNNIAWLLKKLPIFVIPGSGEYRLQPIFVKDLAQLALRESNEKGGRVINAAGPEVLEYLELIQLLAQVVNSQARLIKAPPWLSLALAKLLSLFLRDVLLTQDELAGLIEDRLYIGSDHIKGRKFSDWAKNNAHLLGQRYTNELARHHQSSPN